MTPKVALFDIETAPSRGWYFDLWKENNIIETDRNWHMLSFAYKWQGEKSIAVHDCAGKNGDDKQLVTHLWKVFDAADVLVAHNGDRFDIRKANARFIAHGLSPPSSYKSYDTYKAAKRCFRFDSNRLDSLGQYLGVGRKLPNTGTKLWLGCIEDDPKSWATMRKYNAQDVALLDRVYNKLRAWDPHHPNLSYFTHSDGIICPTCQSPNIVHDGFAFSRTGKRQRIKCRACGARAVIGGLIRV